MDHRVWDAGRSAEEPNSEEMCGCADCLYWSTKTRVSHETLSLQFSVLWKQFSREDLNEILKCSSQFIILSFNKYENEIHNSSQMEEDGKSLQGMINELYL